MAAISQAHHPPVGSHAGVSIGEDGPSQMALEDLAMMRAVHGSTVLYPCDANQTARWSPQMADLDGIVYLRTTREKTPVLYAPDEEFPIGGSRVVRRTDDDVAIVAAGITVHEALKAPTRWRGGDRGARDRRLLGQADRRGDAARGGRGDRGRIVVEDHWPEGGGGGGGGGGRGGGGGGETGGEGRRGGREEEGGGRSPSGGAVVRAASARWRSTERVRRTTAVRLRARLVALGHAGTPGVA